MSDEARRSFQAAQAALARGERRAALSGFLMALALAPEERAHRRAALNILGVTAGYKSLPAPVLDGLRHCATDPALDVQPLALIVKTLFEADPRFAVMEATPPGTQTDAAIKTGAWDWFLNEPMLLAVLSRATAIGLRLEHVLNKMRAHGDALLAKHQAFFSALVLQLNMARFPWGAVTPATPRALRVPLLDLSEAEAGRLPDVLRAARNALMERRELAKTIPTLTTMTDAVSKKVADQYEAYPYPPWDALGDIPPLRDDKHHILSAGCGTGRGAVMLALAYPDAKVTAFDLSRASLAYAMLKAEQHGASNITFGIGDILNVADLRQSFDLIECSGVLHHMADPAAGLRALAGVLKPGGIIRLALYSERGRGAVIAARALIAARDIADSDEAVRQARQVLTALPMDHPARGVVDTPEFFTLDGLHDLIFNVQETRYTPRDLKKLLMSARLEFLGFDLADSTILQNYKREFPTDLAARDLDNWDAFEQKNAGIFTEMYQFWCRQT